MDKEKIQCANCKEEPFYEDYRTCACEQHDEDLYCENCLYHCDDCELLFARMCLVRHTIGDETYTLCEVCDDHRK